MTPPMQGIPSLGKDAFLLSTQDVLRSLRVESGRGLSSRDAEARRVRFGVNTIPRERRFRFVRAFFERFKDILVLVLLAAAGVSLLLGHVGDAIIIAIAISLDVLLSFVQVWRTERTLANMRQRLADTIIVIRNGTARRIPSSDLVVGDIIELRAGETVPADGRIIRSDALRTQEATLTGEAADVEKGTARLSTRTPLSGRKNMVFTGTNVVSGAGAAVVTAVGLHSEFGKIAQVIRVQQSPPSPLRRKLQHTGTRIGFGIIAAVAVLAGIGLYQGEILFDTAHTAITLVVSAIPEDLTMILTITLTVGVVRILRRGGVVRKLTAAETLGASTVICTDKTGTLTEGKMTATSLNFLQGDVLLPESRPQEPMHALAVTGFTLATDARRVSPEGELQYIGSATERTALAFAEQAGIPQSTARSQWRIRDTIHFSPEWKYRAALADHPTQGSQTIFVTGAPEVLLEKSSQSLTPDDRPHNLTASRRKQLASKIESLADEGQRLLGIAVRRHVSLQEITHDDIHSLLFLGALTIHDPVRADVADAIAQAQAAGLAIKLITGDHEKTARAVARQVGLTAGEDMVCDGMTCAELNDEALGKRIKEAQIFSRIEPLEKQRLVRLLQKQGHIVAMTGDGINDAVALQSADIGVAMASGSDIAKDSADLVLLDNSFATIVAAIREGRVLRDNIRKVLAFLLATNAAEVAIFFVSVIAGWPLPLLPAQILWINLVTDGTSDIALSLEGAENNVMHRKPEHPNAPLLGRFHLAHIISAGAIMTAATMTLYWYLYRYLSLELVYARTMAFTFLAFASLMSVWSFRSPQEMLFKRGFWSNPWVPASAGFSAALHLLALYVPGFNAFFGTVPLGLQDWGIILVAALITVGLVDMRKVLIKHTDEQQEHQSHRSRHVAGQLAAKPS